MKEKGLKPAKETYINVLRIHAKDGEIATMFSEVERLKSENIAMQYKDILQLVYDLAVNGHEANCERLFGLLAKNQHYARLAANTINRLIWKNKDDVAFNLLKILGVGVLSSAIGQSESLVPTNHRNMQETSKRWTPFCLFSCAFRLVKGFRFMRRLMDGFSWFKTRRQTID